MALVFIYLLSLLELKLDIISVVSKLVKKPITNLDLSKASSLNYIP